MSTRPNAQCEEVSPPPKHRPLLEPSPYPLLWKRQQVDALRARAGAILGYKIAAGDDQPNYPPRVLLDLGAFATSVVRLCRSHDELENLLDEVPDAPVRSSNGPLKPAQTAQIFSLKASGMCCAEIARTLKVNCKTVRKHLRRGAAGL